jgi:hypothetical protein
MTCSGCFNLTENLLQLLFWGGLSAKLAYQLKESQSLRKQNAAVLNPPARSNCLVVEGGRRGRSFLVC